MSNEGNDMLDKLAAAAYAGDLNEWEEEFFHSVKLHDFEDLSVGQQEKVEEVYLKL